MTLFEEVLARKRAPQPPRPDLARAVRLAAGVSQERMAKELGVARITISRWESGERRPRGKLATAYTALLAELQDATNA